MWQFQNELLASGWFDGSEQIEAFKLEVGVDDGLHAFGRNALPEDGQQPTARFILRPEANLNEPFVFGLYEEFFDVVREALFESGYFLSVFLGCVGRGRFGFACRL